MRHVYPQKVARSLVSQRVVCATQQHDLESQERTAFPTTILVALAFRILLSEGIAIKVGQNSGTVMERQSTGGEHPPGRSRKMILRGESSDLAVWISQSRELVCSCADTITQWAFLNSACKTVRQSSECLGQAHRVADYFCSRGEAKHPTKFRTGRMTAYGNHLLNIATSATETG